MLTVTTAATKFNLIDVATARDALGITDNAQDAAVTAYINRASDVLARQCKRVFALETVSEQFRLDQMNGELVLARYPVGGITSIIENSNTLTTDDYEVNKDAGIITRLHGDRPCYWSTWKITVVYSAGYDLPAGAPPALQQAAVQLVKAYYIGADRDPMVSSETADNISTASYISGAEHLPPDVRGLIQQFRNIRTR